MHLARILTPASEIAYGALEGEILHRLDGPATLGELLAERDLFAEAERLRAKSARAYNLSDCKLLAPVDNQEVWAAGVTYKRSKVAREEESAGAAQFYDKVYSAARPELFLKSIASKVVHPGDPVRIRKDSKWNVPEPELTLVVSPTPARRIVGYTIGNDMSSRDIEGENPLYLPQAKIYNQSCSIGPAIVLAESLPKLTEVHIRLTIRRGGQVAFAGETSFAQFNRTPEELVEWLTRENDFPHGCLLLTGTGIVPPDDFSLTVEDNIAIEIDGIGTLYNRVVG